MGIVIAISIREGLGFSFGSGLGVRRGRGVGRKGGSMSTVGDSQARSTN
jgi:hypothetical protein